MLGSGLNLVTTVIGFGMSVTFIVFICARLICGRIRSGDSRATTLDIEMRSDLDPREHTIHGLDPVAVTAIPSVKYSRESFESKEDAQCTICLADYQEKEFLRILPTCHHVFHLACIDVWLQKQSTCPICRLPLNDSSDASPTCGVPSDHSNQWLLPSHPRSEGVEGDQEEIHDPATVHVGSLHGRNRDLTERIVVESPLPGGRFQHVIR